MKPSRPQRWLSIGLAAAVALMVVALGWAVLALPTEAQGLSAAVDEHLDQSGAGNPVTAVLLNFRGYDTLLEVVVLLLAALGARSLIGGERESSRHSAAPESPLLGGFLRLAAPVMVVVAGYLLWVGGDAPGGAFQGGALLAALGVLLLVCDVHWTRGLSDRSERGAMAVGAAAFLVVGIAGMIGGGLFLELRPPAAKWLILAVEAAVAVSVAAVLNELFLGGRLTSGRPEPAPRASDEEAS